MQLLNVPKGTIKFASGKDEFKFGKDEEMETSEQLITLHPWLDPKNQLSDEDRRLVR